MSTQTPRAADTAQAPLNPGDEAPPGTPGSGADVCPACHGSGKVNAQPCQTCGGTGQITRAIGGG